MRTRRLPLVVLAVVLAVVAFGPFVAPWPPGQTVGAPFTGPSPEHLLGTDKLGRDVLSRLLHGGWRLLLVTVAALACAYAVAVPLGLIAGLRRRADGWVMRPVDALVVLPWFLLLAVLATVVGRGAPALLVAGALTTLPWVARVVRNATLDEAGAGYVEAAEARAEPWRHIALREVLPNIAPVVLADAGMRLTATLSVVTVGGYLGLGLPPDVPDWALAIAANQSGFTLQPWAVLAPALMIVALVVSVNLLADARESRPPTPHGPRVLPVPGPTVQVSGLTVRTADGAPLLTDVDLTVDGGLAIVGASGAGKSTLARALVGALPPGLVSTGEVRLHRADGGRVLGWVPQDPALALNPALRIGTQLRDVQRAHGLRPDVPAALAHVGLPDDRGFARRYPHEISGGQQQRVLLALALIAGPAVLVLDEPTTGLDPSTAASLLALLATLRARGVRLIVVTHDLPSVVDLVDEVAVLDAGRLVKVRPAARTATETAPTGPPSSRPPSHPLVSVRGLAARYGRLPVLDDVDLEIGAGECLGLVGRSGAGKSTLARCLAGLHPPERGRITFDGHDLARRASGRSRGERGAIQFLFQNPARSLNPRRTVADELRRPLRLFGTSTDPATLLGRVGLDPALLPRRTARLSGGQQQRVAIARALAAGPRLLVCDEITASLDPHHRTLILNLLQELRDTSGLAILFVSHDVEAVATLADRILDLADGGLVEHAPLSSGLVRGSEIHSVEARTPRPAIEA